MNRTCRCSRCALMASTGESSFVENPGGVAAQWCANWLCEEGFAVLGAEDKMDQISSKRLRHRGQPAPLQGACQNIRSRPRALPWAIILRRLQRREHETSNGPDCRNSRDRRESRPGESHPQALAEP